VEDLLLANVSYSAVGQNEKGEISSREVAVMLRVMWPAPTQLFPAFVQHMYNLNMFEV
jgi:hypothetical protein